MLKVSWDFSLGVCPANQLSFVNFGPFLPRFFSTQNLHNLRFQTHLGSMENGIFNLHGMVDFLW